MAVHPSSVIGVWLENYRESFYVALTDMEEYSYNLPGEFAFWQGQYTNLMSAINAWKNATRTYHNSNYVRNLHTCVVAQEVFGYSVGVNINQYTIFDMDNFVQDTLGRPVSYYSDYTALPSPNSPRITSSINQISTSTTVESNKVQNVIDEAAILATKMINKSLFVTPTMATKTKEDLGKYLWENLNYVNVYESLSDVPGGIDRPPYVAWPP